MTFKIGDKIKPLKYPELKGEIIDTKPVPFVKDGIAIEKTLYILDWGGQYFADELDDNIELLMNC